MCGGAPNTFAREENRQVFHIDCPRCGRYSASKSVIEWVKSEDFAHKRPILCGQLRIADERGVELELTRANVETIVDAAPIPRNPADLLDRVLLRFAQTARPFTAMVTIHPDEHLSFFLPRPHELFGILDALADEGYIRNRAKAPDGWSGFMEMRGWQRVQEIQSLVSHSWRAFVAMSFAPELAESWTEGIKPALQEAGYTGVRVDEVEHLGKIDDQIIAELRQCGLVVADFTLHRAGVYFEAGYAMGRGVPVIMTCREDQVAKAHFDTRQYNHLVWTSPDDLRTKLLNRIRATLPARRSTPE